MLVGRQRRKQIQKGHPRISVTKKFGNMQNMGRDRGKYISTKQAKKYIET